jgi:flagellar biosynthesis protein FlhF
LKTLLRERQHSSLHRDLIHSQPEVAALYHELARLGVQEPVIAKWLQQVQILLRPDAQKRLGRQAVLHALMQSFSVADPWESAGDGPRCWAFLGTAGVGKTTTLAKLAVVAALARKQRVGLISLDHQRLGAMEQLAAFARLTDLPFLNVHGRTELIQAVTAMHHLDCIFIDTPGRNPHEPILGRELKELLGDLPHLQCHLLISAGAAESLLAATIKGFGALPLASLILAKVDENPEPGGWFNQICLSGLSLSFLTTGPRVPEDLVPASRPLVVSLLLGSTALSQETEVPDTQPCEVNHHAGL